MTETLCDVTSRSTMTLKNNDVETQDERGRYDQAKKPLNSAEDAVAAAEAELKAAQEKLEAAKARLAAEANDEKKADGLDAAEASVEEPVEQEAEVDKVVDVVAWRLRPASQMMPRPLRPTTNPRS